MNHVFMYLAFFKQIVAPETGLGYESQRKLLLYNCDGIICNALAQCGMDSQGNPSKNTHFGL